MITKSGCVLIIAAIAALAAATLDSEAAEPLSIEQITTQSATVESIDTSRRLIWLRDHEGRSLAVKVPLEMHLLTEVKIGDKLSVRYRRSLAAIVKPKSSGKTPSDIDQVASAAPGTSPDTMTGRTASTTVVIQSVDKSTYAIAYKDANGFSRNTTVTDPDVRKFVATLQAGDQVEITYADALALSVELEK